MRAIKVTTDINGNKVYNIPVKESTSSPDYYIFDAECIKQTIEERLSIIQGEFYLNTTLGVPVLKNKDITDLAIQNVILSTTGVQKINSFTSKLVDRNYSATMNIDTVYNQSIIINI